jgi:hypothetical protein
MCRIQESSPHAREKCTRAIFFSVLLNAFLCQPKPRPAKLPDSLHAPSIGRPVLHFVVCFLTFVTFKEVFANKALFSTFSSFRSSPARGARSRQQAASAPRSIKDRLGRYLAWFAHFVKGHATPPGPNQLRNLGNSGRFRSPLRTALQSRLYLNLAGASE